MQDYLTPAAALPEDGCAGTLVGRAWLPGDVPGPSVVALREDGVFDLGRIAPTITDLLNADDPVGLARAAGERIGDLAPILANSAHDRRDPAMPYLLAPCDLQALKASGVTFATSLLERVIEEHARGDASKADAIRRTITDLIGTDLSRIAPGSDAAMRLKEHLIAQGAWSQYLEVGIGPDAEIFTKTAPMAAVGTGSEIGIRADSSWNNPEPELVLAVSARGAIVGATLGNDVNLRDFEGRSALLLGKSKDNNASCAIGPFLRLLDDTLSLDRLRRTTIGLRVRGEDGFELTGTSSMAEISRDVADLVGQTIGPNHQYPDGLMLFCGTMFAPIQDRDHAGEGFTHKVGDVVTIACPELGMLANRIEHCDRIAPWTFGANALMRNLARRRLL
ncbi:MAG TPA: fumarylacetoacetate hydrolase family protein [Geminicoccaceae bacterium]|nr:fumarylacetoacetate hydrolase family protein [Geminicoccaceae bacterium]